MHVTVSTVAPSARELQALLLAADWQAGSEEELECSMSRYPCKVVARTEDNDVVGYASVFSDEVMSTMLGELVVHPLYRRRGIAKQIMLHVESLFPRAPIYVKALAESKHFYIALGYKQPRAEMTVLFKRPEMQGIKNPSSSGCQAQSGA